MNARSWADLIKRAARHYKRLHWQHVSTVEVEGRTVKFHLVGHNASHFFWIAVMEDGRIALHTEGESVKEDSDGYPLYEKHTSVYPLGEYPSYLGHW